ncbi:MAG TPA: hypothetical protein VFB14_16280 [Bryobacteraceae bacterium]|jgi:hypothetical protein|nr:hypothetical protein [Bryobacteraceae bacterium]
MNRKQNRSWLLTTLLAISSATLSVTGVHAQQIAGSFTLPYTLHWGLATLPPGHYTLLSESQSNPFTLRVRGAGTAAIIMSHGKRRLTGERSALHIVRHGNQAAVASLDLAYCGTTFEYATHLPPQIEVKQASNKSAATVAETIAIDVPITVSGQ